MPEVFKKNCKIKVIEYGEHYRPSPFWRNLLKSLKSFTLKKTT